jgi:cyclin B
MVIPDYMSKQTDINSSMRTILVDWLVEVQENFELFHETLYIAVRLVDTYLSRKEVKREYLQLVGATCMLIAAKFEVRR